MTNEESVLKKMNFSRLRVIYQVFIMQAIENQCDTVIRQKEEFLKQQENDEENGKVNFVNLKEWVGVAEEIKEEFKKRKI